MCSPLSELSRDIRGTWERWPSPGCSPSLAPMMVRKLRGGGDNAAVLVGTASRLGVEYGARPFPAGVFLHGQAMVAVGCFCLKIGRRGPRMKGVRRKDIASILRKTDSRPSQRRWHHSQAGVIGSTTWNRSIRSSYLLSSKSFHAPMLSGSESPACDNNSKTNSI